MTESTAIMLSFVLLGFLFVIWRCVDGLRAMSGASIRAHASERRDDFQWFERLLEKHSDANAMEVARLHAGERVAHVRSDATTEREADKQPEPTAKPESEYCSPQDYEE